MPDRIEQIDAYLDGALSQPSNEDLRDWVAADPAHAGLFAERAVLHHQVRELLHRNRVQSMQGPQHDLTDLLRAETRAAGRLIDLTPIPIDRELTRRLVRLGAVAAVIVIVGVAAAFLLAERGNTRVVSPREVVPVQPYSVPSFAFDSTVATLTAGHGAGWQAGPGAVVPEVGQPLLTGHRLVLTAGFAEITTRYGARVLLEAPCTVEMIDHPNALRLHQGSLVGICETQASQGLLVRTPHMDITDLSTRFAVSVSDADTSEVHVIEGSVRANATGPAKQAQEHPGGWLLEEGEALLADGQTQGMRAIPARPQRFVAAVPSAYERAVRRLGPTGYWRFDADQDGLALSSAGDLPYPGAYRGGMAARVAGPRLGGEAANLGLRFNGKGTELHIPDVEGVASPGHAYSIAMWVRPRRIGAQSFIVRSNDKGTEASFSHQVRMSADGRFEHYTYTTGQVRRWTLSGNTAAELGRWHHVVITGDERSRQLRLFVNGVEDAAPLAFDEPLWRDLNHFRVGSGTNAVRHNLQVPVMDPAEADLDELAVFNRALSPQEVQGMYDSADVPR